MPITLNGDTGIVSPAIDVTTPITVTDGGTGLSSAGTSGNVLTSNGTTWTSAAPATTVTSLNGQTGAITNTDYGAIGSYVVAAIESFGIAERLPNVTVAGSTLIRTTVSGSGNNSGINLTSLLQANSTAYTNLGLSGTWRRMTRSHSGSASGSGGDLYVRIS